MKTEDTKTEETASPRAYTFTNDGHKHRVVVARYSASLARVTRKCTAPGCDGGVTSDAYCHVCRGSGEVTQ